MSAICEGDTGTTRLPETASKYVTADRPETTAVFPPSQEFVESNPNYTTSPNSSTHQTVFMTKRRNLLSNANSSSCTNTRTSIKMFTSNVCIFGYINWTESCGGHTSSVRRLLDTACFHSVQIYEGDSLLRSSCKSVQASDHRVHGGRSNADPSEFIWLAPASLAE